MIEFDLKIQHHFSDGIYAKKMEIPKDHYVVSHKHTYDHLSILASGRVLVEVGDVTTESKLQQNALQLCQSLKG